MGTRFEVLIPYPEEEPELHVRACAEAVLDEIALLDRQLSLFRKDSYLAHINRNAFVGPVRVDPQLFELIATCRAVGLASRGAFDITVGPLMRCWGFHALQEDSADSPANAIHPAQDELARAATVVGGHLLRLDRDARTVMFEREGMRLDLGGVAKGYALDRALDLLVEEGVSNALLHGGTSTVAGLGPGWKIGIRDPRGLVAQRPVCAPSMRLVASARLRNRTLSVSAPHGRERLVESTLVGHLVDPASGTPAKEILLAAVIARSATLADAWSTALVVAGVDRSRELIDATKEIEAALLVTTTPEPSRSGCGVAGVVRLGPRPELFELVPAGAGSGGAGGPVPG